MTDPAPGAPELLSFGRSEPRWGPSRRVVLLLLVPLLVAVTTGVAVGHDARGDTDRREARERDPDCDHS